jgi:hypothetical protein
MDAAIVPMRPDGRKMKKRRPHMNEMKIRTTENNQYHCIKPWSPFHACDEIWVWEMDVREMDASCGRWSSGRNASFGGEAREK